MLPQSIHYAKKGVFTVLTLFLSIYVFTILLTYTPNDPSWSHIGSSISEISNMGGAVGAWLSDLLYAFFGIGAWLLFLFFVFEAVMLWRDNHLPSFALRFIAYVFLMLSVSALCSGMAILFAPSTASATWTAQMGSQALSYGGIIGFEVLKRLSHSLSTVGALVFLLVFTLITATFAFDLHFDNYGKKLYRRFKARNAIPDEDLGLEDAPLDAPLEDEATDSNALNHNHTDDWVVQIDDGYINDGYADDNEHNENLPLHDEQDYDVPADAYGQIPLSLPKQQAGRRHTHAPSTQTSKPTKTDLTDANMDNLFSDFLESSGLSDTLLELQAEELKAQQALATEQEEAIKTQKDSAIKPQHQDEHNWEDQSVIDALLAEQDDENSKHNSSQNNNSQSTDNEHHNSQSNHSNDSSIMEDDATLSTSPIDMTPTNTPPANPKAPNEERVEPSIKFDVAEGDSSNRIEEMMPSSDEARLDKVMPPIEDDAAFKTKSRAMQTAKHRQSLTPIPSLNILDKPDPDLKPSYSKDELEQLSELLEIKLQDFNVKAEVVNAIPGPVVTRFEVELAPGIKASKVTGISRDLARSLSMASLRVVEVIPGKPYIGIEVPNKKRQMVRLIELLSTAKYKDPKAQISMAMGKDIGGKPIITDLARAPHMLVAGTTGSGKSVLVNSMLLSMLLKYKPDELRLILIDPKQLELANYNEIPHLLTPVVTDMNEAASSLSWCVAEMERRYQLMSLLKVRKLGEFNKKVKAAEQAGRPMIDPLWRPNDSVSIADAPKLKTLPMIVIVADEFADMIMQVGKQAEELITRLAQKSRAAGIHLMLATQRPSVDVITGLIKANIPVRAALRVNSKVDSRTILDAGGAEDMLGNGDMLFLGPGQIEPERVHGAYVSDEEVNRVCDAWRERGAPDYIDNMASNFELSSPSGSGNTSGEDDQLYDEAVAFVMETRKVSASSIQRKFSIGYNRAARIVDSMEEAGLVSAMGKSGKRELLM